MWRLSLGKRISIHQPHYLPWVPYFNKILQSDQFVFLDNVQFQKNGMQNRNQIKTKDGVLWLTVPVMQSLGQQISETVIADKGAVNKHLKTIEMAYKKSPHFNDIFPVIVQVTDKGYDKLSELNCDLIMRFLEYFGYKGEVIKASQINVSGRGSDLVLDICRKLGASKYISGPGGKAYMKLEDFGRGGVAVEFQDYKNVEYPQLFAEQGFIGDLSVVDLLFNMGKESLRVIEMGRTN